MHRFRTHTCGELRESDIGATARLSGWLQVLHQTCQLPELRATPFGGQAGLNLVTYSNHTCWRDVRVVEGARLESVCGGNLTVGSNPTLSVRQPVVRTCPGLLYQAQGGLCNWSPRIPPGPEGSNGSGSPNVTQYPPGPGLALSASACALSTPKIPSDEIPSHRAEI